MEARRYYEFQAHLRVHQAREHTMPIARRIPRIREACATRAARQQAHLQQAVQARAQLSQQHGHLGLAVQQQPAVDGHAAGAGAGLPPHLAAEQQQRQRAHHGAVAQPHLAGLHLLVEHLARGPMALALYPAYPNPASGAALRGSTYGPQEATRRLLTGSTALPIAEAAVRLFSMRPGGHGHSSLRGRPRSPSMAQAAAHQVARVEARQPVVHAAGVHLHCLLCTPRTEHVISDMARQE